MIKVSFALDKDENIRSFSVKGHAGFAQRGQDIVCAAVSVLAQTAVIGLEEHGRMLPEVAQQAGDMSCELPKEMNETQSLVAEAILKTCYLGMLAVKNEYPDYLNIEVTTS